MPLPWTCGAVKFPSVIKGRDRERRDRERAKAFGLMAAIPVLVVYGGWRVAGWAQFLTGSAYEHRSDFAEYYLTASIGERFGWRHLYSQAARDAVARTVPAPPIKTFPIDFPPLVGWLVRPFTSLSIDAAYWIWLPILVAAYLVMWWLVTEGSLLKRLVLLVAPLTVFPVVFGFALGQVVVLEMLGVAVAYACLSRRWDFWAGLALTPLLLHPQCFLLVPLILIPLRRWWAVLGFAATAALQGGLTLAILGSSGIRAFLHQVNYVHAHRIEIWTTLSIPLAVHNRIASDAATAAVVLVVLMVAGWNRNDLRTAMAAAIIGSLLVAPFIHAQDEMSLLLAVWLVLAGPNQLAKLALPLTAFCLLAVDGPRTKFSWGHLVMGMEAVWLVIFLVQNVGLVRRKGVHFVRSGVRADDPGPESGPDQVVASLEPVGAHFWCEGPNTPFGGRVGRRFSGVAALFWRSTSHFPLGDFEARSC